MAIARADRVGNLVLVDDLVKFSVVDVKDEATYLRVVDEGARAKSRDGGSNVLFNVKVSAETKGRSSAEGARDLILKGFFVKGLESTTRVVNDHDRTCPE